MSKPSEREAEAMQLLGRAIIRNPSIYKEHGLRDCVCWHCCVARLLGPARMAGIKAILDSGIIDALTPTDSLPMP